MTRLLAHELAWQIKIYLRDPMTLFFVAIFPIAFVVFQYFRGLDQAETLLGLGVTISVAIAGLAGLAINLAGSIERGVIKRIYVSPLPMPVHFLARLLAPFGLIIMPTLSAILVVSILSDFTFSNLNWPVLILALSLGLLSFGSLGMLLGVVAKKADRASFLSQAVLLPLLLLELVGEGSQGVLSALVMLSPLHALFSIAQQTVHGEMNEAAILTSAGILIFWAAFGLILAARKVGDAL